MLYFLKTIILRHIFLILIITTLQKIKILGETQELLQDSIKNAKRQGETLFLQAEKWLQSHGQTNVEVLIL